MIEVPLKEDSLKVAMRRFQDFVAVHSGKDDYLGPLAVLRESLGITEDMVVELTEWCNEFLMGDVSAPVLLGVMMGLIAADHANE